MERIPEHIKALVRDLPYAGARLDFGRTESHIIALGRTVPITILEAEISRPEGEAGYVVLVERIRGGGEFNLVIKDPVGKHYVFSTTGFEELTGLASDVVCGGKGELGRRLLEDIYNVANVRSSRHHRAMNLIPEIPSTLTGLPFP